MEILVFRYFDRGKRDFKPIKTTHHWNWTCHKLHFLCNKYLWSTHWAHIFRDIGEGTRDCVTVASRIHDVTSLSLLQTRRKAAEWIFISNEDTGAHKEKFLLVSTPSAPPLAGFSGNAETAFASFNFSLYRSFCSSEFHLPLINTIIKLLRKLPLGFIVIGVKVFRVEDQFGKYSLSEYANETETNWRKNKAWKYCNLRKSLRDYNVQLFHIYQK